jgi:nucleoid-associated protein YgaU
MLSASSRYTTSTANDVDKTTVIAVRKSTAAVQYVTYTSREGDSFAMLATRLFNDPSQYWRIADINPQIKFPDLLETGSVLRLPK